MSLEARTAIPTLRWVYLACIVLGGIATHLASELFAIGPNAEPVLLSPRHWYLALAAAACATSAFVELRQFVRASSGLRDLKRQLTISLESLPMRGRWQFYALTMGLQFAVGIGSAVGEGCFFCGHDVAAGLIGALLTAFVFALAGRLLAARLPRIAARLAALVPAVCGSEPSLPRVLRVEIARAPRFCFWSTQLANRPPPLQL